MDCYLWYFFLSSIFYTGINADFGHIHTIDVQQDERIRLECTVTSKLDIEEAMWMRIRSPHNPDILTYRDTVVYASDRIQLDHRRLSSSVNANGSLIDTYFLTLTILRPTMEDEGRYVCTRGRTILAEYDLYVIVPPHFDDDNSYIQQQTVIEGATLHISCSAQGRPKPSITWFSRTNDRKHIALFNGTSCQDTVCDLHWGNYSRNDPSTIECIADNEKSTRVSKVFHIDVHYPPKVMANVQVVMGSVHVDVLIECSSVANPPASITWLDHDREEIHSSHTYHVKKFNQSSSLDFSLVRYSVHHEENSSFDILFQDLKQRPSFVYYCLSNNSIGIDEKLINISSFIPFNALMIRETTTTTTITTTTMSLSISRASSDLHPSKKPKTLRPSRARSRPIIATTLVGSTTIPSSCNLVYSFYAKNLFYLIISLFVICFV